MQFSRELPDYIYSLRSADGRHAQVNERALSRSLTALVFFKARRKIAPKPIDGFALDNVLVAKQPYIGWVDGRLRQQHVEAKRHQIVSDAKRTPIAA